MAQHDREKHYAASLHIAMLDEFGDATLFKLKDAYRRPLKTTNAWQTKWGELRVTSQENKARELGCWSFQIAEIEAASKWMRM